MSRNVSTDTKIESLGTSASVNWDDYRTFITVVRAGNFYRAAAELSTTQATVSRRILALEEALEAKLFDRPRGRGTVELTCDGKRVFQEAVLAELCLSRTQKTNRNRDDIEGDCKLLGTDGLSNFWMPAFLKTFGFRYPNVQLKYFLTMEPARNQRPPYDLQMQYLAGTEADTISLQLATIHFTFLASKEYLSNFGRPRTLRDLQQHRVFKYSSFIADENSWAEYTVDLANQHAALYSNSSAMLGELVLAGAAITVLPTYVAATEPSLVAVLPDFHLKAGLFLNFSRETSKKPAVRTTIDFLKEIPFDRRRMPWFRDEFEPPSLEWHSLYASYIDEATQVFPKRMAV